MKRVLESPYPGTLLAPRAVPAAVFVGCTSQYSMTSGGKHVPDPDVGLIYNHSFAI